MGSGERIACMAWSWLWGLPIGLLLLVWRFAAGNDEERRRRELMAEIRKELNEVKKEIVAEIRSSQ
jgi:hypothetical protein